MILPIYMTYLPMQKVVDWRRLFFRYCRQYTIMTVIAASYIINAGMQIPIRREMAAGRGRDKKGLPGRRLSG